MIDFIIYGELASKANSRRLVSRGGKPMFIKSEKGLAYVRSAMKQIPREAKVNLEGELIVHLDVWYASQRPDLDESLLLDILQAKFEKSGDRRICVNRGVYLNDRQVREKHVYHHIDKNNPRVRIRIEPRNQGDMLGEAE